MKFKVGDRVFLKRRGKEYDFLIGTIICAKSDSVYSVKWKNIRTKVEHSKNHWAEMLIPDNGYNDFCDKIKDRLF